MTQSWALISGASTGIGRALAIQLAKQGFHVMAGVRSQKDGDALAAASGGNTATRVVPVTLDVTDTGSIMQAVDRARELTGTNGLRAVVNNAGIVVPGPLEYISADEWRRQFDVNFFGMIELTRATLPLLRQGVTAHGARVPRLLFVSSIGGRVAQPMMAPYTSCKFATSALGDSLRLELLRQGIGVTVIEPGAIATEIWRKADAWSEGITADHPARKLYGREIDGVAAAAKRIASRAISADAAADAIIAAILAARAPARVLVGRDAKIMAALRKWLPLSWFDALLMREFGFSTAPALPSAPARRSLPSSS